MLNSFTRKFVAVVLVCAFSCFSLGANANEDLVVKPKDKPHPNTWRLAELHVEREILESKNSSWSMQRDTIREFIDLMFENPDSLEGERGDYYIKLLHYFNEASFVIDKILTNPEAFADNDFNKLSLRLTLYDVAIRALLKGANINDVADIIKDSELEDPKFKILAEMIKNQSKVLSMFLKAYSTRSFHRGKVFVAIQEGKPGSFIDIDDSNKTIEFTDEQRKINNKLIDLLTDDLYLVEAGSLKEEEILKILEKKAKLQGPHGLPFGHELRREKIDLMSLYVQQLLRGADPNPNLALESTLTSVIPYLETKESKLNAVRHLWVYTELDVKYEEESYWLLRL